MSIIKNVSGPYTINTVNHDDPIILDSNRVYINGNLTVLGETTTVTSTNTSIDDNIITLNAGTTGTPTMNAGLEVDRGSQDNSLFLWNETTKTWQVFSPTFPLGMNVVSTTTGNTRVVDDASPQLGANLFTAGYAITNSTGNIFLDPATTVSLNGNLSLQMAGNTSPAGYNTLSARDVSAGGTGLYVTTGDGTIVNQELITKKRSIVYSIVFG